MAEEVQISNVGGDGVASEVTLQRLVTSIEAMAKKMGIDSKSQAAKLQKLYNQEVEKSSKATKEQTGATEEQTTATKEATQETNKFARSLGGAVAKGLGSLYQSAMNLGSAFWNNNTSIEGFASQLPVVGKLLGGLGGIADESIDSFRSLTASGAAFGGSITNMRNAAAGMEISLSEMTELFTAQAPALAALGGTVEEGAARFASMNKNIKSTGDFQSLMEMGFSVGEINEGMADYIELQGRMGRLQGRSTAELADGSANYLRQIDLLARVTGKTREQAQAALDAQAADSVARTLLNQFDRNTEEGQRQFNNLTSSLALLDEVGGASAEALKGMLTENLTPAAGKFMAMLGDSGDTVHAAMMEVGKGADPQVLLNAFKTAGGKLEEFAGADAAGRVSIIRALRDAGDPMADYLDGAARMIDLGNRSYADARAQQDAQTAAEKDATDAMLAFEKNQREVSAAFHKAFVASGVLDAIGAGLSAVAPLLTGMATSLSGFAETLGSDGWVSALTGLLMDGLKGLWNNAGVVGALVAGIGVLFASKVAAGALTRSLSARISGMFGGGGESSTGSSPRGRANAGRGAGNAMANIGGGIGKGLGGILKGLAGGIMAFANPAVALGAAGLAASIVLIGGAIAGATWMVGKSLPTMAEGLKSFEELDGAALIDAGKGMGAIALGMAAFGAGSAVGGLGNLVGSVTNGIAGLFGAEDPLEKIKKFQEYSFDAARIENNATAIVSYSRGMAALGAADGLSGIGAAVGAIGGAIAGLFGAEDPLDKMKRFGEYEFNTAGIIANAGAVAAYATAMKDFPASPSASVFTAAKDAIIGLLGGETDPFAPMKAFGELQLNTAGITNNAGAVSAFAAAMQNMPTIDAERSGGVLGALAGWFAGDTVMPWDSVKAFGDADISSEGVTANAEAINAMTSSLNGFSVERLDTTGIISYTNAMERLVEVLGDLNEELGRDNNGMFTSGTGENAGSVMSQMNTTGSGGRVGGDQLNNIMNQVLLVLNEIRDLDEDVERNTRNIIGSNLAQGGVSNVAR